MSNNINIHQIITVAEALKDIKDTVVFVGGSTTVLLVDSVASGKARQTEDVDFIVEIAAITGQAKFDEKMRSYGFRHDMSEGAPICRWLIDFMGKDLKVDAMPASDDALGFTNIWYQEALNTAWQTTIKEGLTIRVVDPVYFLGTKFEAYQGRGKGSIFSHDIEDIVYVLEHRSDIERLVFAAPEKIKTYLKGEFNSILNHPDLTNSLAGILDNQDSLPMVLNRMKFIASKC